jgi:hypothetical protein
MAGFGASLSVVYEGAPLGYEFSRPAKLWDPEKARELAPSDRSYS